MKKNVELKILTFRLSQMKLSRTLIFIFMVAGLIPPFIFRAINWYHGSHLPGLDQFAKTIFISVITTLLISISVVQVVFWLHRTHPWKDGVAKRLLLEVSLTTLTACTVITILTIIMQPISPKENLQNAIFDFLIVAVIMNFILVAITEGLFFFKQWRDSTIQTERYKNESIKAQLDALKAQVNPHFLFNSLNTLSGLIDHDAEMSKEFVDDLSTVYRYVLEHKDEEVVKVSSEMKFIQAFIQLLKKRHGDSIAFHINLDPATLECFIPPLTLQILIENSVKHNVASSKRPLTITIFNSGDRITVRNNLQRKKNVLSTKIGLDNIRNRYAFLLDKKIEIVENDQYFEVRIPLITSEKE